jgi:hypothetical protein
MRRFRFRLLVLALAVAVIFAFPLLAPTPHRVDQSHFDLVQDGMTMAQAETIFGVPAGNYDWAEQDFDLLTLDVSRGTMSIATFFSEADRQKHRGIAVIGGKGERLAPETWISRHGTFTLAFDSEGKVIHKHQYKARVASPWQRWWKAIWKR